VTHHFTPETENVEFYDVTKQNLRGLINQEFNSIDKISEKIFFCQKF
jgi:hypothetical protein